MRSFLKRFNRNRSELGKIDRFLNTYCIGLANEPNSQERSDAASERHGCGELHETGAVEMTDLDETLRSICGVKTAKPKTRGNVC